MWFVTDNFSNIIIPKIWGGSVWKSFKKLRIRFATETDGSCVICLICSSTVRPLIELNYWRKKANELLLLANNEFLVTWFWTCPLLALIWGHFTWVRDKLIFPFKRIKKLPMIKWTPYIDYLPTTLCRVLYSYVCSGKWVHQTLGKSKNPNIGVCVVALTEHRTNLTLLINLVGKILLWAIVSVSQWIKKAL